MSGPKTSRYTLTAEQRRIMQEQREIQRIREHISQQKKEIRVQIARIEDLSCRLTSQLHELKEDDSALSEMKKVCAKASSLIQQSVEAEQIGSISSLSNAEKQLSEISSEIWKTETGAEVTFKSVERKFRSAMERRISDGFSMSFDFEEMQQGKGIWRTKIDAAVSEIKSLIISNQHLQRLEVIVQQAEKITDDQFLKNYYAVTVTPFLKECQRYNSEYMLCGEEFERKYSAYRMNTEQLGISSKELTFSMEAIRYLDEQNEKMEELISAQEEQAYISKCVDEAMREMGYQMLGDREVIKRSGKKFCNHLYTFGDGTAVNVTYASDGQITMELGGVSEEDRVPTAEESDYLVSDMRSFCEDYQEIENKLRKKGIVSKHIMVLPPEVQFAQIINVSDYNVQDTIKEFEVSGKKRKENCLKTQKIGE